MRASPQRSLARVLRDRFRTARPRSASCSVLIAAVAATPDSKHVTVTMQGVNVVVPRLASYTAPVVGEACYLLAAESLVIAIGAVR